MNTLTYSKIAHALADLSELLDYPNDELKDKVARWRLAHAAVVPAAGAHMEAFQKLIADQSTAHLEELYTRTFDVAPTCTPYITAYVYGDENYERGNLMSKLTERYDAAGFDIGNEMPDHIRVLLQFAPQFSHEELSELTEYVLMKPVTEMRESLSRGDNPYAPVMRCLLEILSKI